MEKQAGNTYSLRNILEKRYLSLLIEKSSIDPDNVVGETTLKKIDCVLEEVYTKDFPSLDTFIDYQKKLLYKILDSVLDNSKEMMHPPGNKRSYLLNEDNIIFINFLLDSYYDDSVDIKNLLDRRFDKISLDFRELFCRGLRELADNENTSITPDYAERIISLKFELSYNETVGKIRDLECCIDRYAWDFYGKEDSLCVYEQVQEIVQMLIDCIPYTTESNENIPNLDFEKVKESMEETRIKAKERSDRIKKGWETRRKNNL